jgi:hypothetical protein
MKTTRSAYKLGKVEEWKSSGLSIGAFAKKNGFSKTGFDYWVKKSRKLNDIKSVSFVELEPAVKPREIIEVSSELREPASHQAQIVITFPGGMSVKIYG